MFYGNIRDAILAMELESYCKDRIPTVWITVGINEQINSSHDATNWLYKKDHRPLWSKAKLILLKTKDFQYVFHKNFEGEAIYQSRNLMK